MAYPRDVLAISSGLPCPLFLSFLLLSFSFPPFSFSSFSIHSLSLFPRVSPAPISHGAHACMHACVHRACMHACISKRGWLNSRFRPESLSLFFFSFFSLSHSRLSSASRRRGEPQLVKKLLDRLSVSS